MHCSLQFAAKHHLIKNGTPQVNVAFVSVKKITLLSF